MRYKINNFNEGITVTQGLIAVNVIIFLNMSLSGDDFLIIFYCSMLQPVGLILNGVGLGVIVFLTKENIIDC